MIIISVLILSVGLTNCTKIGCTDVDADNYVAEAEEDNNSCQYGIDLTIYMSDSSAANLEALEETPPLALVIGSPTVPKRYVGAVNWKTDSTYAVAPACGATGPNIFNLRFIDFRKGPSLVNFKTKNGNDIYIDNIKRNLILGEGRCAVISM